jgi:hypothetical protein
MRTIHDVLIRLRAEYLEMPGLRLQRAQIERLCGIEPSICELVLDALVAEHFLYQTSDGQYARVSDGGAPHPSPAKAGVRPFRGRMPGTIS